jgi:DNA-binding GntR family transcriptional regulator
MDIMFEKEFSPQYPISLVEQITEFLTSAIIEGGLAGEQRLVENELQRRFGISRAPIRESFRILEKNGLVNIIPRKGTFVRKITQKDVRENFPIRAYLEGLAARLATSNIELKDVKGMELALSRMTEEAKNNNFKSYFKHHNEHHEIFINASRNDTLIEIIENLRRQAVWFRFSYLWHQENFEYATRVHREILDLLIKREADQVENLVKEHILIALDRFLEFLASNREASAEKRIYSNLRSEHS